MSVRERPHGFGNLDRGPPVWIRYGVAILAVVLTQTATVLLEPEFSRRVLVLPTVAVVVSSLYGGLGPGLLASILGALGINYFWVPPLGHLEAFTPGEY